MTSQSKIDIIFDENLPIFRRRFWPSWEEISTAVQNWKLLTVRKAWQARKPCHSTLEKSALSTFATKTYAKRSNRIGTPLQGFLAEVSPHNFAQVTSETLMASERKDSDSDQDEDEDPWGFNRLEADALY